MSFTHLDNKGNAIMVDVGGKEHSQRKAVSKGRIKMSRECFDMVVGGQTKKGDVFAAARIAGIMAAKRTSELIPLCHTLLITSVSIDFNLIDNHMTGDSCEVEAACTVGTTGQTGVEMEALTGVSVALFTIYDMCKAVDKSMVINGIYLSSKTGGKSGDILNPAPLSYSSDKSK